MTPREATKTIETLRANAFTQLAKVGAIDFEYADSGIRLTFSFTLNDRRERFTSTKAGPRVERWIEVSQNLQELLAPAKKKAAPKAKAKAKAEPDLADAPQPEPTRKTRTPVRASESASDPAARRTARRVAGFFPKTRGRKVTT